MSFLVSLDTCKTLGNRLAGKQMVGAPKFGPVKPTISGAGESDGTLSLDAAKVLGTRLSGASMVGISKPGGIAISGAVTLDVSKTLGARVANPQMVGSSKPTVETTED
ncbi:hypothetical protein [Stappia sp. ES.058]|uniref:hypothetical protein n=1 Tax=Stappia sp. ES.058 TaxID=1881061 RepID=UPI000B8179EE|nr:hypothetical protein [Stappia sp. ES.058]